MTKTPCVKQCKLEDAPHKHKMLRKCLGCGRMLSEIVEQGRKVAKNENSTDAG